MDSKSPIANFAMLQTFLAAAGLLAPRTQSPGFIDKLRYQVIAVIVISTIGICFLLTGLYMYLATIMPPYQVCLIMGAVILALGLAILASRIFAIYMIKRKINKTVKELYNDTKDILATVTDELKKPIQENPKLAMSIAAIVGFILVRKFLDNGK